MDSLARATAISIKRRTSKQSDPFRFTVGGAYNDILRIIRTYVALVCVTHAYANLLFPPSNAAPSLPRPHAMPSAR